MYLTFNLNSKILNALARNAEERRTEKKRRPHAKCIPLVRSVRPYKKYWVIFSNQLGVTASGDWRRERHD